MYNSNKNKKIIILFIFFNEKTKKKIIQLIKNYNILIKQENYSFIYLNIYNKINLLN